MYGKQFVTALLFLAVTQVNAQYEDDTYGAETDVWDATPEPDVELDDDAAEVTIPDGDWLISSAAFEVFELADDDAIYDWADGSDWEPSGLVLFG